MNREEAIDIIRKNIPHLGIGAAEMTEALNELIPELRESEDEDERIRKEIVGVIQKHYPNTPESYRWISWLEKQKENPKSADSISADCVSSAKCEDRSPKHIDSFGTDIRDTPAYWRGWDDAMKQKEQKPAEKQDYSGLTDLERAILRGFLAAGIENVPVTIIKETAKECLTQMKPAECIEDSVKFEEGFKAGRESGLRDGQKYVLNNLDSYGLCKPAEWSEEDEEHINSILERLEGMCKKGATFTQTRFAVSEDKDWLKFLHPSWKPNDNQMSMLRAIVNDPNNVGAESCHLAMQSLYNDLLKLK